MSRNYFDDVGVFHIKFGLPVSAEVSAFASTLRKPQLLTKQEFEYRDAFLHEEQREFVEAHATKDLARCADALADIVWIALGTAHYLGIPFDRVWAEVRRANLQKRPWQEGDPLKPRNVVGLEVVKPEGWKAPQVQLVLDNFTYEYFSGVRP